MCWASRHQRDGHGGGMTVMVVDVFVCLRSFHEYEALPTPPTLLGLTSSSGAAGRRGTCVPCGALTPPLRTREPGCHGRRRPLRVPQASCWVVPTGCHCPASPVVPWVGPWIWPPRRRRWCWEYWAIPVREDNAPPAPVSVDGEPHNEPPRAAFPPRGYVRKTTTGAAPQEPAREAVLHATVSSVPLDVAAAPALLRGELAHRADGEGLGCWGGAGGLLP